MSGPLPALVSAEWLASALGRPGLRVLDGSWYLPGSGRNAAEEYAAGHIPGALFFDLDATSDRSVALPHMLPRPAAFAEAMSALGLSDSDDLVVYDGSGVHLSAPRVWWTFRTLGHERVSVLDGGMVAWRREGRPVERGIVRLPRGRFTARPAAGAVRSLADVRGNIQSRVEQVVDTRSAGRFAGFEPEPRPGVRSGHIPGSLNLPFSELTGPDGTLLPLHELKHRIETAGIDLSRPVVATCGSGTSACALVLSLHLLGHTNTAVYDGAWAEWGSRPDTPLETTS